MPEAISKGANYKVEKKEEHIRYTPALGTVTVIRFWATSRGGHVLPY